MVQRHISARWIGISQTRPPYLDSTLWQADTADRSWEWKLIDGESKLVYRVVSMESSDDGVRTHRSGRLNRDKIQRAEYLQSNHAILASLH